MASQAVSKVVQASARRVLERVAKATGAPVREGALAAQQLDSNALGPLFEESADVQRELRQLHSVLGAHQKRAEAAAARQSSKPLDFAECKRIAKDLSQYVPEARGWSVLLERAEREEKDLAAAADSVEPRFEDAVANALVPLERAFADVLKQAEVMADTSRARIEALEAELAQVEREITALDTLTIDDVAKSHPEWAKAVDDKIASHEWNLEMNQVDQEAHDGKDITGLKELKGAAAHGH